MLRIQTQILTSIPSVAARIHAHAYYHDEDADDDDHDDEGPVEELCR